MIKYSDFKLQPLRNHKFKLLNAVIYKDIKVPAGFHTDGATIPRIFWSIYPPNRTDYLPCAIIHDYLCDLEQYDKADEYFKECLKDIHAGKITQFVFYWSVRIYHIVKYKFFKKIKEKIKNIFKKMF